jgi:hypothetical protein
VADEIDGMSGAGRDRADEPEPGSAAGQIEQVAEGLDGVDKPPRVFISYAHESDEHGELVRDLWVYLRSRGVDAILDRPAAEQRQEWTAWMDREIPRSDFILVVASPEYRRRAAGEAPEGQGRGVEYEAALIRGLVYEDRKIWFRRVLPVLLPGCTTADLPRFLVPAAGTSYRIDEISDAALEQLLRVLLGAPYETASPLGPRPAFPPRPIAEEPPVGPRPALSPRPIAEVPPFAGDAVGGGGGGNVGDAGGGGNVGDPWGGGEADDVAGGHGVPADRGEPAGARAVRLRHEVTVEVGCLDGGRRLHTRTLLAGTVLGEHTAVLPTVLTRMWGDVPAGSAAADEYLARVGHLLRDTLFDAETARHLAELAGSSPIGTVVDVLIVGEPDGNGGDGGNGALSGHDVSLRPAPLTVTPRRHRRNTGTRTSPPCRARTTSPQRHRPR